ncbi:MAG: response regulator [Granulosicoccaceae bacterium]
MHATILIVKNEPGIRDMIRFALEQKQFQALTAESVNAATDIFQATNIDAILVDWMLPGANGIHLIKQLRKNASTSQLPIIMITAKTDDTDISQGLDEGADDYITKPFIRPGN